MPIQTTAPALSAASPQSAGNILNLAHSIRAAGGKPWGPDVAGELAQALQGLQNQSDKYQQLLSQPLPSLKTFSITDTMGALIGSIGDLVVAGVQYFGGWVKQFRIGGADASLAQIVADVNGNVAVSALTYSVGGTPGIGIGDVFLINVIGNTTTIGYTGGPTTVTFVDSLSLFAKTAQYTSGLRTL